MSGLETIALAAVALWLAVLSLAAISSVRQIAMLTAWAQERSNLGEDGLETGADVPETALEGLAGLDTRLGYVLFLAGNCQPCREFALEAGQSEEIDAMRDVYSVHAVVIGDGATSDEVVRLLPNWIDVVRDPVAGNIKREFSVGTTPSVFEVERGKITGRAVAGYGVLNFMNLVRAREHSNAEVFAGPEQQSDIPVTRVTGSNGGGIE